jgi:hypothetical protein
MRQRGTPLWPSPPGVGHPVQLALNDFLEVSLESVKTAVAMDEQPEILWERED